MKHYEYKCLEYGDYPTWEIITKVLNREGKEGYHVVGMTEKVILLMRERVPVVSEDLTASDFREMA